MKWQAKSTSTLKTAKWHLRIGAIFTTYYAKKLNSWLNSSVNHVMNYNQLSACQGEIKPFEDHPSTRGRLTILRNKSKQKQPRQLSASIPG